MTPREREVFSMIKDDPMITQEEIAGALGISRSVVSVHISSLLRQGILRGRGYVLNEEKYHIVLGPASIDFIGTIEGDVPTDSVNPNIVNYFGKIRSLHGGAGFNIADYLRSLGENTRLIAPVGSDLYGRQIVDYCNERGIGVDECLYMPDAAQPMLLQLRNEEADSATALSDYSSMRLITAPFLESKERVIQNAQSLILTDLLSPEAMDWLIQKHPEIESWLIFSGAGSRILKLREFISKVSHVYMNLNTAAQVVDMDRKDDIYKVGTALQNFGVQDAFISCRNSGILHVTQQETVFYETLPGTMSDSERGKDSFVAGLVASAGGEMDTGERIRFASQTCIQVHMLYRGVPGARFLTRENVEAALMG